MIPPEFMWRTNDGRTLDIRWMDSVHLAHSFNMLCRKNGLTAMDFTDTEIRGGALKSMVDELKARGQFDWGGNQTPQYGQLTVPLYRETRIKLCMFRAFMDHDMTDAAKLFMHSTVPIDHYLSEPDRPGMKEVIASFAAYRLEQS